MSFIETSPPVSLTLFRQFERTGLPVLAHTADAIATLRVAIDDLAPHDIPDVVEHDSPDFKKRKN